MIKTETEEYNPDVKDGGLNLQMKFISRKEARGLDARVILGATVGVMINGYTHEDQSTSPRRQRCTKKSVSQFRAGLYWWAGLDWYGGLRSIGRQVNPRWALIPTYTEGVQVACVPKIET